MSGVIDLIDRAATDPAFLMEFSVNPLAAARTAGLDVSHDQVRDLLGTPGASDGQLAELLQARLSYASKGDTTTVKYSDNTSACAGCAGGT